MEIMVCPKCSFPLSVKSGLEYCVKHGDRYELLKDYYAYGKKLIGKAVFQILGRGNSKAYIYFTQMGRRL